MRYLLAARAIAWGMPAFANPQCGDRTEISEALRGSFTAILTQPGGPTCIVVTGESGNILPAGDMG